MVCFRYISVNTVHKGDYYYYYYYYYYYENNNNGNNSKELEVYAVGFTRSARDSLFMTWAAFNELKGYSFFMQRNHYADSFVWRNSEHENRLSVLMDGCSKASFRNSLNKHEESGGYKIKPNI
jgi:hypothetical protein